MTGFVDAIGRTHQPAADARIVSLVPSLTETLFALGLRDQLVARTSFCIHPVDQVGAVKSVGGTKQVNWKKVDAAEATHAILNIDENPKAMAAEFEERGVIPIITHPLGPEDNAPLLRLLGGIFDRRKSADVLADEIETALARFGGPVHTSAKRVLYLIWKDPWMTVSEDTYISRLLSVVGWRTVAHDRSIRYPAVEMTGDLLGETDLVLFSSEPFRFTEDHLAEFKSVHPNHAGKGLLVDGELLSWYGVRAIKGLAYLRNLADENAA